MKTAEAIKGKEWQVLAHWGLEETGKRHIQCPICQGKNKFRLNQWAGGVGYVCVCGSGDTIALLLEITGLPFKDLAKKIDELIGNTHERQEKPRKGTARDKAILLFKQSRSIIDTQAQEYLNNRGLFDLPRQGIKYGRIHNKDCMIALASTEFS